MRNRDIDGKLPVNKNKKILILLGSLFLTAAFFLFNSENAMCSEKMDILAVGEGKIKGNNAAEAKSEAIADALKKGMEEYLSTYLGSQGMISNFSVLINEVTPTSGEEIENFHILAEEKKGEKYSILVRVKVNEKLIEQRLKELGVVSAEMSSIKVLFLVSQEKDASKEKIFWWKNPDSNPSLTATELKLYNVFQEQGMEPVNRLSNPPDGKYSESMKKPELTKDDAIEWGRLYSADVVIKGKAIMSGDNAVSVDLEAISVADGALVGKAGRKEQVSPTDSGEARFSNALETAIRNVSVQLSPQIFKSTGVSNAESNKVQITLKDLRSFDELRLFKKFLEEEIGGIKSVVQSRVNGQVMGLSVEYTGTKEALLNKIKNRKSLPFQAEIADEGEGITVKIVHEIIDTKINQDSMRQ
jgi:hypothetical protein